MNFDYKSSNNISSVILTTLTTVAVASSAVFYLPLWTFNKNFNHCWSKHTLREPVNSVKVPHQQQQLVNCSNKNEFPINNIMGYCTDNSAYSLNSFKETLKTLSSNFPRLRCLSHFLNLISKAFYSQFWQFFSLVSWSLSKNLSIGCLKISDIAIFKRRGARRKTSTRSNHNLMDISFWLRLLSCWIFIWTDGFFPNWRKRIWERPFRRPANFPQIKMLSLHSNVFHRPKSKDL